MPIAGIVCAYPPCLDRFAKIVAPSKLQIQAFLEGVKSIAFVLVKFENLVEFSNFLAGAQEHNKIPSSFKKQRAWCIHDRKTTYAGYATTTPAKIKKPAPADRESYCQEAVRTEMHATLLFSTVLTDAMALVQVVRGECHPMSSDIGDLTWRIEQATYSDRWRHRIKSWGYIPDWKWRKQLTIRQFLELPSLVCPSRPICWWYPLSKNRLLTRISLMSNARIVVMQLLAQEENFQWLGGGKSKEFLIDVGQLNSLDKRQEPILTTTCTVQRNHSRSTDQSSISTRGSQKSQKRLTKYRTTKHAGKWGANPGNL